MKPLKPAPDQRGAQEIELKLALPSSDPAGLARRLGRTALLARRKPTRRFLHNVYYDTPGQSLREQRVALRLRRVDGGAQTVWLQTLKIGGGSGSALSQRGEWETPVAGASLDRDALAGTPWPVIDPKGSVFEGLDACFVTSFERTSWLVRRRDGSIVEVALDQGQILADGRSCPICELELELKAGPGSALFDVARQIAQTIPVLPVSASKSERGYALAVNLADKPLRAQPAPRAAGSSLCALAQDTLREMFCQFTTNLNLLGALDDPELVHQARVGWRRFKSALRLFRSVPELAAAPAWQGLHALLGLLGEVRDVDVARTQTLPALAQAYAAGDATRGQQWAAMQQALAHNAALHLDALRDAVQTPSAGLTLLEATQWLEGLAPTAASDTAGGKRHVSLARWARRRAGRLHARLLLALEDSADPDRLHQARILAKRLRYAIETLRALLPRRRAQRWYRQATALQSELGAIRDLMRSAELVAALEIDDRLVQFVRGVATGYERARVALPG